MLNATTTAGRSCATWSLLSSVSRCWPESTWFSMTTLFVSSAPIFIFMILAVSYNPDQRRDRPAVAGAGTAFVAVGAYVTALLILSSDSKVDMFEMAAPSPWILSLHAGFLPALLDKRPCARRRWRCASPCRSSGYVATTPAIVTLGFGFIIKILAINNPQITNGAIGLNDIPQQPHLLFWCGLFALLAHRHDPPAGVVEVWPDDESYSRR